MKNNIVLDARMLNNSGISNYIDNIFYKIINHFENYNFLILLNHNNNNNNLKIIKKLKHNNYEIVYINSPIYSFREQIEIFIKLFKYDVDLFWSPHYNIPIFIGSRLLVTIHDVWHLVDNSFNRIIRRFYAKTLFLIIKLRKAYILSVSNFTKQEIFKYTNNNYNITVIHNGLEKKWKSKKSYKLNNDILYVGNIRSHKNIELLINSFNKLKLKDKRLLLVGKNDNYIDENLYDKSNIKFLGEIKRDILIDYYNNARMLILPSKYEGFGFTPLEAMACECPVLNSDIASLNEICKDGAIYFSLDKKNDLEEKIIYLLNNNKICDELIKKANIVIKKYNWNKTANETIKIIDKLLVD